MRTECHPLLRGRREESKYSHGLSSAEMESLSSICETILPPLPPTSLEGKEDQPSKPALQAFSRASGSETPMPDEVFIILSQAFLPAQRPRQTYLGQLCVICIYFFFWRICAVCFEIEFQKIYPR